MKKSLSIMLFLMVFIFLIACSDKSNDTDKNHEKEKSVTETVQESNREKDEHIDEVNGFTADEVDTEHAEDAERELDGDASTDKKWETEVGDVIENEGGQFTLLKRQDDIDQIKSGPILLTIEQLNAVTGKLKGKTRELMQKDTLEYLQLDVTVENTSDDIVTFYTGQVVMVTNTGERIESDIYLSDYVEPDIMPGYRVNGTYYFVLEASKAVDVHSVRLIWSPPHDKELNDLGEPIEIDIEF